MNLSLTLKLICHLRYITANTTAIGDVNEMIFSTLAEQRRENRKMLLKILSNVRYLARLSLAFRGDWNKETGNEENSNFNQFLYAESRRR